MTLNPAADLTATPNPGLAFEPERYLTELSGLDLSAEQKVQLLTALWQIMRTFVELGVSAELGSQVLQDAGLLPSTSDKDGEE